MPAGKYRVVINGFTVTAETWDDALEWDGKRDEVFLATSIILKNRNGDTVYSDQPTSPPIGDTNNQPGRIQGGSASPLGGIRSGDAFPHASPWFRSIPLSVIRNWPPCTVWEGDLTSGDNVLFVTPTIWEWDPGQSMIQGWVDWHQQIDAQFGQKAKEIVSGVWPLTAPVFDAVSLGIQTAATMFVNGPVGSSGSRPIGFRSDPAAAGKYDFNPWVLTLTYELAEQLVMSQPAGLGPGVLAFRYDEAPYFRGDYTLYVQIEKVGGTQRPVPAAFPDGSLWREQSDPNVYLIEGGAKFWIPNPTWLARYAPRMWDDVTLVPDGSLNGVPVVPRDNTILREWSDSAVFIMLSGQRRWIRTIADLDRYTNGARWLMVRVVPDGGLAQIPQGSPAP